MPNQTSDPNRASHSAGKAFYILLCAILGATLFIIIQRALALVYYLLLNTNYNTYSFGMSAAQLQTLDLATVSAAVFFGLWYGVWLGLHWYQVVYEEGHGGLFHGFRGGWRHKEQVKQSVVTKSVNASSAPVTVKPSTSRLMDMNKIGKRSWEFEDLLNVDKSKDIPAEETSSPVIKTKTATVRKAKTNGNNSVKSSVKRKAPTRRSAANPVA
jgi:hypothetical protein